MGVAEIWKVMYSRFWNVRGLGFFSDYEEEKQRELDKRILLQKKCGFIQEELFGKWSFYQFVPGMDHPYIKDIPPDDQFTCTNL